MTMANRYPISTVYFCGNCEEEVTGFPAGSRIISGRPLCLRCTQIGIEEGWAQPQNSESQKRIYDSSYKPGIIVIGFFITVLLLIIGAVLLVITEMDKNR